MLLVPNASPTDAGNYTCVVENSGGRIQRRFSVDVVARIVGHAPIVRHGQPGDHNVTVGDTVRLSCRLVYVDHASPPHIREEKEMRNRLIFNSNSFQFVLCNRTS
jgi:hypothetical protein